MSIISVEGLRKSYQDVVAVDDISFEVNTGEILGILGPNGSGKTTTLKSILGLITFDRGMVSLNGINVATARKRAIRCVGAILEGARNIYWFLSPLENIIYFAGIRGYSRRSIQPRADELLDRLGLDEVRDKEVRKFSSGMKQKTSLACALVHDPDILLLDEPTLGLDVETASSVRNLLRELGGNEGKTILVTSHDMGFIESVCDRVLIIREGRIISHETIDSLRSKFARKIYSIRTALELDSDVIAGIGEICQADIQPSSSGGAVISFNLARPGDLRLVLGILENASAGIEDITVVESSLEDIFLDLVGRIWE